MNLAALNQKVNRVFSLIYAWIAFIPEFVSITPKDVTITVPNEDGTETTRTHPNLAKWTQSVASAVAGEMEKTYYVDYANGNDTANGSSAAPFKTIKRAIDAMPAMSFLIIRLKGTNHIVDSNILGGFSKIKIYGDTSAGKSKITFSAYNANGYNYLHGIDQLQSIMFYSVELDFDLSGVSGGDPYASECNIIRYGGQSATAVGVQLCKSKINLPDNSSFALILAGGAYQPGVALGVYNTEIHSAGAGSRLVNITSANLTLARYSATYTGAITTLEPLISGIVKDGNGVPRNFQSNIVI